MNARKYFAILIFLGWLPLVTDIYHVPSQMTTEIERQASEAVRVENELIAKGVARQSLAGGTKEEWIEGLTLNYWLSWAKSLMFFVVGLIGALMTFFGRRNWKWVVGASSCVFAVMLVYPLVLLSLGQGSLHWAPIVFQVAFRDGFRFDRAFFVYSMFFQPIYHLGIVVGAILLSRNSMPKQNVRLV